jgi:membrane protease YdiL (CAAX protease family)
MQTETPAGANKFAIAGLLCALIVTQLPIGQWVMPGTAMMAMLGREAVWWLYVVALLFWLRDEEGLPFSSIGWRRPTGKTFFLALFAAVLLLLVFVLQYAVIIPVFHLNGDAAAAERLKMLATPFWYRVLVVLRAAVCEEIIFRGYIIEKVRQLTGSWPLAFVISVVAFTAAHLSKWGAVHLIPVAGAAVILGLFYVWKRDLPANMIAHFIIDGIGFLL